MTVLIGTTCSTDAHWSIPGSLSAEAKSAEAGLRHYVDPFQVIAVDRRPVRCCLFRRKAEGIIRARLPAIWSLLRISHL